MFRTLRKLWYLILTFKPFHHFSGQIATGVGILLAMPYRQTSVTSVVVQALFFVVYYSALYQMNELFDYERDRHDSIRKNRPLAAGKISRKTVTISAWVVGTSSFLALCVVNPHLLLYLLFLAAINFLYVRFLKHTPYIDILVMSSSHFVKFFVGVILVTLKPLPSTLYLVPFFFYFIAIALQCNKKIGRILFHPGPQKFLGEIQVFRPLRSATIALGMLALAASSSIVHGYLWAYSIGFSIYAAIPALQKTFFQYQKWYSKI